MKNVVEINGRKIVIYDDVFSMQENIDINNTVVHSAFKRCNVDIGGYNLKDTDVKWRSDILPEHLLTRLTLPRYASHIGSDVWKNLQVINQYINYATPITADLIHTDSCSSQDNAYTILHYANFKWESQWHGETIFYDDNFSEALYAVTIKPGRVVMFNSNIPHSATSPSTIAEYPRYTIVTKTFLKEGS